MKKAKILLVFLILIGFTINLVGCKNQPENSESMSGPKNDNQVETENQNQNQDQTQAILEEIEKNIKAEFPNSHFAITARTDSGKIYQTGDLNQPYFIGNISQIPYLITIYEILELAQKKQNPNFETEEFFNEERFEYGVGEGTLTEKKEVAEAVAKFVYDEAASQYNSGDHQFFEKVFIEKLKKEGVEIDLANEEETIKNIADYMAKNNVYFSLKELSRYIVAYSANWPLTFLRNYVNENHKDLLINENIANNVQENTEKMIMYSIETKLESIIYTTTGSDKAKQAGALFNTSNPEELIRIFNFIMDESKDDSTKNPIITQGMELIRKNLNPAQVKDHHLLLNNFTGRYGWWYHHKDEKMILTDHNLAHGFDEKTPSTHVAYVGRKYNSNKSYIDIAYVFATPQANEELEDFNIDLEKTSISKDEKSITKKVSEIVGEGVKGL
jgi:hypothetical protein